MNDNNVDNNVDKTCSICLNEMTDYPITTKCGHNFHPKCIKKWAKLSKEKYAKCPNCNTAINVKKINDTPSHDDSDSDSDKDYRNDAQIKRYMEGRGGKRRTRKKKGGKRRTRKKKGGKKRTRKKKGSGGVLGVPANLTTPPSSPRRSNEDSPVRPEKMQRTPTKLKKKKRTNPNDITMTEYFKEIDRTRSESPPYPETHETLTFGGKKRRTRKSKKN